MPAYPTDYSTALPVSRDHCVHVQRQNLINPRIPSFRTEFLGEFLALGAISVSIESGKQNLHQLSGMVFICGIFEPVLEDWKGTKGILKLKETEEERSCNIYK